MNAIDDPDDAIESDEKEGDPRKPIGTLIDNRGIELRKESDRADAAIDVREVVNEVMMLSIRECFEEFCKHITY